MKKFSKLEMKIMGMSGLWVFVHFVLVVGIALTYLWSVGAFEEKPVVISATGDKLSLHEKAIAVEVGKYYNLGDKFVFKEREEK